jgi:predicted RNA methylase
MSNVLLATGRYVIATDLDPSEYDAQDNVCKKLDFLEGPMQQHAWIDAIVTNPPFGSDAQKFVERALEYDVMTVSMLLRSEFRSGKTRRHLFGDCPMYAGEIVLTSRPRWDWWFRDKPKASPRHNFSWFVWDMRHLNKTPYQRFHYKEK